MTNTKNETKTKNSIIKDALVLFVITIVSGLALGVAYEITQPVIQERNLEAKRLAYQSVYEDAQSFVPDEELEEKAKTAPEDLLSPSGFKNVTIDEVLLAQDVNGNPMGHVMTVTIGSGYSGDITISMGYSLDGFMQGLEFLVLNETVGFGQNANNPEFKDQFVGKQASEFVATNSDPSEENEVDGISGATMTTDAVLEAINGGILFLNESTSIDN